MTDISGISDIFPNFSILCRYGKYIPKNPKEHGKTCIGGHIIARPRD